MVTTKNQAALRSAAWGISLLAATLCASAHAACPADLDGSGSVDLGDVAAALLEFGGCPNGAVCAADVDGTGTVDLADVALVLLDFGPCPAWYTVLEQVPNSSVVWHASLRNAITATGKPWRVRDNGTGIEMVLIPPGTFTMGCSASDSWSCFGQENPTHQVTFATAFYMSRTEVTQAQWVTKMGSNPSYFTGDLNRPVERVSWNNIQPFLTTTGLRLPTEAEWEYAYRAGTTTAFHGTPGFPNGSNNDLQLETIAWYSGNTGSTTNTVAGKAANGFGLYDMSGNVLEWCQDWFGTYTAGAQANPTGPSDGYYRVLRGGSRGSGPPRCRASDRNYDTPGLRTDDIGFRVARSP